MGPRVLKSFSNQDDGSGRSAQLSDDAGRETFSELDKESWA
jgi:hypothetical protein